MNWRQLAKTGSPSGWRMAVFFMIMLLLSWAGLQYVDYRLADDLFGEGGDRSSWMAIGLIAIITIPSAFSLMLSKRENFAKTALMWVGFVLMGLCSTLLVLTLLRDIVMTILILSFPDLAHVWPSFTAKWTIVIAVSMTTLGYFNARRAGGKVTEHVVHTNKVSPGARPVKVIQLSDIHIGQTIGKRFIRRLVTAVNKQSPDIIVITGDLVDGRVDGLAEKAALLAKLQASHGVFIVFGNHDYYSGCLDWQKYWSDLGFICLVNEHRVVKVHGTKVVIAGITDHTAEKFVPSHRPDPGKALQGAPLSHPVIMLAHQPISASYMPSDKITIQLSGHTHAGQFFPWGFFVKLQQPIVAGHSDEFDHPVYVNRGTGYWGPPKRLLSYSEISVFRISPEPVHAS